jgi:hypothetical protein
MPSQNFDENDIAYTLIEGLNDEDHVVYPDPETGQYQLADNAPLQEELAALAEYQYIADTVENHDDEAEGVAAVDEQEEEEVVADAIIVATPWAEYHAYGREPSDPFEGSESVPQPRKPHKLSDFVLGWGLYCIVHGVSRKQYAAQLQLLKMLGPVEKVRQLPESLDTLKRHVRESLPHIDMRTAKDQVPTVGAAAQCARRPALHRCVPPVWVGVVVDGSSWRVETQVSDRAP